MGSQECLELLRGVRDCAFATIDRNGLPAVRIIDVMLVKEGRLFFCTARGKDFYAELLANSAVAVTGLNDKWQTVRLMGRAERLADAEQHTMIDRIFEENPSMNEVYPGETRYILERLLLRGGALNSLISGKVPSAARVLRLAKPLLQKKAFSSRRPALAAARVRVFARSSASRTGRPMLSMRRIVCTAACAMRAVL